MRVSGQYCPGGVFRLELDMCVWSLWKNPRLVRDVGVDDQEGRKLANTYGPRREMGWKLRMEQREKPEDCDPSCCAFTHRVAFEEGSGSEPGLCITTEAPG